eukprot:COSAG01_NODE_561_length_15460_cov_95.444307_11_plen_136_part_00
MSPPGRQQPYCPSAAVESRSHRCPTPRLQRLEKAAGESADWMVPHNGGDTPLHTLCSNRSLSLGALKAGLKAAGESAPWTTEIFLLEDTPFVLLCLNPKLSAEMLIDRIQPRRFDFTRLCYNILISQLCLDLFQG